MEDEVIDEGSDFNFDAQIGETPQEVAPQGETTTPSENPAWNELLSILPQEFQNMAKPHLQKWDQSVQQRFERVKQESVAPYQPFQQFVDQKVDPQELQAAHQLWGQINQDPMAFYNNMASTLRELGMLPAEVQAALQEQDAEEIDPIQQKIQELETQQQAFMRAMQQANVQQVQQQHAAQLDEQINSELAQIESVAGRLPEPILNELFNRAAMMSDREHREITLIEAFQELQQVRQAFLQTRPGANAPRVVPSGGGFPAPQPDKSALSSEDGRGEAIKAIIARTRGMS